MMSSETIKAALQQTRLMQYQGEKESTPYAKGDILIMPGNPSLKVWNGEKAVPLIFDIRLKTPQPKLH